MHVFLSVIKLHFMYFNIASFKAGNGDKTYRWQFLNVFIWRSQRGKPNLLEMFKLKIIKKIIQLDYTQYKPNQ